MQPNYYIDIIYLNQSNIGVIGSLGLTPLNKNNRYITIYNTNQGFTYLPFYDKVGKRVVAVSNYSNYFY